MPRKPIGERAMTDAERQRRHRARRRGYPPLPAGRFGVIYADPPWRFETYSARGRDRCPDARHYPVMGLHAIKALPVERLAADDCALLLWATSPMLQRALEVITAWGFAYKTVAFTWAKETPRRRGWHMGTGYWTRANAEYCLLGTRGAPHRQARDVRQLLVAPVGSHSRKPAEAYERVERLLPGPYLELFARPPLRTGWTAWGNEVQEAAAERRAA